MAATVAVVAPMMPAAAVTHWIATWIGRWPEWRWAEKKKVTCPPAAKTTVVGDEGGVWGGDGIG
jgi:hypothetical protein